MRLVMNKELALLSLRIGMFCGRVDSYLNDTYFTTICRKKSPDFTEDFYNALIETAKRLQVPMSIIEESEEDKAIIEHMQNDGTLELLMAEQKRIAEQILQ